LADLLARTERDLAAQDHLPTHLASAPTVDPVGLAEVLADALDRWLSATWCPPDRDGHEVSAFVLLDPEPPLAGFGPRFQRTHPLYTHQAQRLLMLLRTDTETLPDLG
jgi:hypothetical protein